MFENCNLVSIIFGKLSNLKHTHTQNHAESLESHWLHQIRVLTLPLSMYGFVSKIVRNFDDILSIKKIH